MFPEDESEKEWHKFNCKCVAKIEDYIDYYMYSKMPSIENEKEKPLHDKQNWKIASSVTEQN